MKKYLFLLMTLLVTTGAYAQDDDVYFVPSKKAEKASRRDVGSSYYTPISEDENFESSNWAAGRGNGGRDVDSYNRRGNYSANESDSVEYDDVYVAGDYTSRIVRFHSPRIGIYVSSPFYADYYDYWYDPFFGPAWCGWGDWYGWGWRPYPYWAYLPGWSYPWHYPWGPSWGWHPGWPRPPHHFPGNSLASNRVYRGSNGGVIRYGTGRTASQRRFSTDGNANRPVYRGTSSGRRVGNAQSGSRSSRSVNNAGNRANPSGRPAAPARGQSRSFDRSTPSSGSRPSYSAPSRSGFGTPSGAGRSAGGVGRSGGRR